MKDYLIQFKPFILFLTKFIFSYVILAFVYQNYLSQFNVAKHEVDGFTQIVANQTQKVLSIFDEGSFVKLNQNEPSVNLYYKSKWTVRIVEGCNALSVMILFVSFVVAFTGKLKPTVIFIILGSFIIHLFNVLRIVLITMAVYNYPSSEHILHGVVFPLFIYGVVFVLWIIWVNKFSYYAEKSV